MTDRYEWSASVGRWLGVSVRVHLTLLLFVVLIFAVGWHFQNHDEALGTGFVTAAVLLLSVLLHELAHIFAVANLGGEVHSLTLTPWGGKSSFSMPSQYRDRLLVFLAGPFANAGLFIVGAILLTQADHASFMDLINPLGPRRFHLETWEISLLEITTWVNAQLLFVNLIPCFPFDGGQILRTVFLMVGSDLSRLKIESTLMAIGQLVGFVCFGLAGLLYNHNFGPIQPTWAILLATGITLIFCTRFEYQRNLSDAMEDDDWMVDDDDDDEADSDTDYEETSFNFLLDDGYSQWLIEKQKQREHSQNVQDNELEVDDNRRADQILRKLHDKGIESLNDDERSVLDRVSARIRRRRQQGV